MSYQAIEVTNDWNTSKIKINVIRSGDQPLKELAADIDFRQARKLAIDLLKAADDAEQQRENSLQRAMLAYQNGDKEFALELAERNGLGEKDLA